LGNTSFYRVRGFFYDFKLGERFKEIEEWLLLLDLYKFIFFYIFIFSYIMWISLTLWIFHCSQNIFQFPSFLFIQFIL
jgi:hypothetical protein